MKRDQARVLQQAKKKLGYTTEQLADALGVSVPTVQSWLASSKAAKHREMPEMAHKLLSFIVKARK